MSYLRLDADERDLFIKTQNIYNERLRLRQDALETLIFTQALLYELFHKKHWFVRYYSAVDSFTRLFFARNTCQLMTKINWEILLIDKTINQIILRHQLTVLMLINCIYKTNRYFMSLCVITKVTSLNHNFFVRFAFLFFEQQTNYNWVLKQLKKLYQSLRIMNLIVIVIDCEVVLINVIAIVFFNAQHVLCIWHVNKNVLKNCRSSFDDEESWTSFFKDWQKIMYAVSKTEYETIWSTL
jgi:hypothetical protein